MLSKQKLSQNDSINLYSNFFDFKGVGYDKEAYIPKEKFYNLYYSQNRKKMPGKLVIISFTSYLGGCFFGLLMLGLSFMGTGNMYMTSNLMDEAAKKYKYENSKEFFNMVGQVKIF